MNEDIMKLLMPKQFNLIQSGRCPICGEKVDLNELTDEYLLEFNISGMCKKCQDRIFNS